MIFLTPTVVPMFYNTAVVFTVIIAFYLIDLSQACSNIIVSPGASSDHSSIVAYNADSVTLYGSLYHYPAAKHNNDDVNIANSVLRIIASLYYFYFYFLETRDI